MDAAVKAESTSNYTFVANRHKNGQMMEINFYKSGDKMDNSGKALVIS